MALKVSTGLRNSMLTGGSGEGFKASMDGGFLYLFSGTQPSSADDAAAGTLLAVFYSNYPTNTAGLSFGTAASGAIAKSGAQTWSGAGLTSGTVGWFRFQELDTDEATTRANALLASATDKRIDGSVAVSGGDLAISATNITSGAVQTVSSFSVTLPES